MKKFFQFKETEMITTTFYCILEEHTETEVIDHRYFVIIEDDSKIYQDEPTYTAYVRDELNEADYEMMFSMLQKDISKPEFIELVKGAIYRGEYI